MKETLFRAYVRFIRPFTEKWLNDRFDAYSPTDFWGTIKDLSMHQFSKEINSYEYSMDRLGGIVDHAFNFDNPNSFFVNTGHSKDCDSFARMWSVWAIYHGYEYQEVIVTTKEHLIKDSHVVTVINIDGNWYLCDYTPYGVYATKDAAIEDIVNHWKKYTPDNLVYAYYYGRKNI